MPSLLSTSPAAITRMTGDGNCFFRALAHGLYGFQEEHLRVRQELHAALSDPAHGRWGVRNLHEYLTRDRFLTCLSPTDRDELPLDYRPSDDDVRRYCATPGTYSLPFHPPLATAVYAGSASIHVWRHLAQPLSYAEHMSPASFPAHLPSRTTIWQVDHNPRDPLGDGGSRQAIHLIFCAHGAALSPALTLPDASRPAPNHYDVLSSTAVAERRRSFDSLLVELRGAAE